MGRITPNHLDYFYKTFRSKPTSREQAEFLLTAAGRAAEILARRGDPATPGEMMLREAVGRADSIGYIWRLRLNAHADRGAAVKLNLLVPALDPGIIFGGYISYFQFAAYCARHGARLRFIVTEKFSGALADIIAQCETWYPEIAALLRMAEVIDCTGGQRPAISFSPHDLVVAYSCSTAMIAHNTVQHIGLPPFIFYIQEEEGHFHSHNSLRALMESVYDLPHTAIFNSEFLQTYFEQRELGVFSGPRRHNHLAFRHALSAGDVPSAAEMRARKVRKLLFFARPERHAERNLFELGLVTLRYATYINLFPPDQWELHAIGSERFAPEPLYNGQKLKFIGRFPLAEYSRRLAEYDVGLALMFAPHPSVPNFEMAASGMITVTTEFVNRSWGEMEAICPNFVASKAGIDPLCTALRQAVARSENYRSRERNAAFAWPRSWSESFDDVFSENFRTMLRSEYPDNLPRVFPGLAASGASSVVPLRGSQAFGRRESRSTFAQPSLVQRQPMA